MFTVLKRYKNTFPEKKKLSNSNKYIKFQSVLQFHNMSSESARFIVLELRQSRFCRQFYPKIVLTVL
jgi:hypothetical protein